MHYLSFILLFTSLLSAASSEITSTMSIEELNKIRASSPSSEAYFGISVAISGNTAVVGAHGENRTGLAYIFEYQSDSNTFVQKAELRAYAGQSGDAFGLSVAIDGDTVVVGAYRNDPNSLTDAGSAYIFVKPLSGWATATEDAILNNYHNTIYDFFGYSVSISGDTVVVGARGDDDSGTNSGSAYIFLKPESGWTRATENAKLLASDGATEDRFGYRVAISGDTVAIGADHDDDAGTDTGSVYLYEKPGTGWIDANQSAKLTASDSEDYHYLGSSLAISGDTVVAGAYGDGNLGTNAGAVYLYEKPSTGWIDTNQSAKLTAFDGTDDDYFGYGVAISADTVVVGAYRDDNLDTDNSGSAYIYEKPNSGWINTVESTKLTAFDAAADDYFGVSVAVSSDTIIVGAHADDDSETDSGSAYILKEKPSINPSIIMYLLNN